MQILCVEYFQRYTPDLRAKMAKYACQHGAQAASNYYSVKLGKKVNKSTIHSIKLAYLKRVKENKGDSSDDDITELPPKKRGRPLLLGKNLDKQVQLYLRKMRENGGVVTVSVVVAAARGIVMSRDRTQLAEFGGHIQLTRQWAYHLLSCMNFVKRKATTAKSKQTPTDFAAAKAAFLNDVVAVVTMDDIPPELVLNWDQTGIHLVPASTWTMDREGSRRVEISGANDKRQITAVLCGSLTGDFLPLQLIYKGKTRRCHPRYVFPSDWHVTQSPKHWSTEKTMIDYIDMIIVPYVEAQRDTLQNPTQAALVVMDNFRGQVTTAINDLLEAHNINVCLLPANTTDQLQPMDIAVNKPAKDFLKQKFEHWYSDEVTKQLQGVSDVELAEIQPVDLSMAAIKELSAQWLVEMAEYIASNPQFVVNGFRRSGIPAALDGLESEKEEDSGEDSDKLSEDEDDSDDDFSCDND